MQAEIDIPKFEPHPLVPGGHAQTIVARYLSGGLPRLASALHLIEQLDGDRLCVLETIPAGFEEGSPVVVLLHGLAGCARSPYIVRVAGLLARLGARVVRMNLRGAGQGFGHARKTYHSGKTEDVRSVLNWAHERSPNSPLALVGFSLGGNLVLKLAAEAAIAPVAGLDCVVAANPPIDLMVCSRRLQEPANRVYDWNFVRILVAEIARLHAHFPDLGSADLSTVRSVFEFDDAYTAPRHGFTSAIDYYTRSSALPLLEQIELPGLVVHAADDPFIPAELFQEAQFSPSLDLELTAHGGHLGFLSRRRWAGSHRWLDQRIVSWLAQHWHANDHRIDMDVSSLLIPLTSSGESLMTGSQTR